MSNASVSNIRCSINITATATRPKNKTQFPLSNKADAFSNSRTIVLMDLSSKGTEMNTPLILSNNKHSIDPVKHGPLYRTPFFREINGVLGFECQSNVRQKKEKGNTVDFIQSEYKNSSAEAGAL